MVFQNEKFDPGHGFGHAKAFFPARQELAIAQTACRASKPESPPPVKGFKV
jgi:hypothetical protein